MSRKWFSVLALLIGLTSAQLAQAQSVEAGASSGTRVDDATGGFKLVTHGVWVARQPPTGSGETATKATSHMAPSWRARLKGSQATSFQRAIYLPKVFAAEAKYGLPTGLLDALIWTESRYNPMAISHAGAAGLGQLMPDTARELGVANRFDPGANLFGAARYLKQQLDRFGLVHLAVAAYNAGPRAVQRAGGIPINGETPAYVRNVLGFWGTR